jgi:hypothetical protein
MIVSIANALIATPQGLWLMSQPTAMIVSTANALIATPQVLAIKPVDSYDSLYS